MPADKAEQSRAERSRRRAEHSAGRRVSAWFQTGAAQEQSLLVNPSPLAPPSARRQQDAFVIQEIYPAMLSPPLGLLARQCVWKAGC